MPLYRFEDKMPQIAESAFVHPEAVVIGDVVIDEGCYIGAGACLRGDWSGMYIGPGSNVQENAVIHGLCRLGPSSHIGHGSVLHACTLHYHVYVGMGSIIMDEAVIGEGCMLGSGTLITQKTEIPARKLVMGVPGKIVGDLSPKLAEWTMWATSQYQEITARYKSGMERVELSQCRKKS